MNIVIQTIMDLQIWHFQNILLMIIDDAEFITMSGSIQGKNNLTMTKTASERGNKYICLKIFFLGVCKKDLAKHINYNYIYPTKIKPFESEKSEFEMPSVPTPEAKKN